MVLFMVLFSSFSFLFFCVCVCVFVCFELCFLSWNCKMKFHNLIFFVLFPWRLKVFLSNFIVVSYLNLNFTIFAVFDFVLYFSLIDFMVIHTEQNVCVVSRLFFFLVKFIGDSLELHWEWTTRCSKIFCTLLCSHFYYYNAIC